MSSLYVTLPATISQSDHGEPISTCRTNVNSCPTFSFHLILFAVFRLERYTIRFSLNYLQINFIVLYLH